MDGEDELIGWLRRRLGAGGELLGDDAAVIAGAGGAGSWVATVDSQIDGVHHPAGLDPALVGRRLLAVNLSDLAAMGAEPGFALLALSAPAGYDHRRFFSGLLPALAAHGVTLAGGDLATTGSGAATTGGHREDAADESARRHAGGGSIVATLTLLGSLPPGREGLRRAAARPGDSLWVGGTLGESAAGRLLLERGAGARAELAADDARVSVELLAALPAALRDAAERAVRRHLSPTPQLDLGRALAGLATAGGHGVGAIDLSDGLAHDLPRLCRASGVGAEVEAAALPQAEEAAALAAHLGRDPLDLALRGGEDYVLLFTLPEAARPPAGFAVTRIGSLTTGEGVTLRTGSGERRLASVGWDHLARCDER